MDPQTGALQLTVPLPISPVRGGISVDLSLEYSFGSGNGSFGIGWALNSGAVFRRTDAGVPVYDDDHGSDRFVVSGVGEIVPARHPDGARRLRWATLEGNSLAHAPEEEHFEVREYRPRVEKEFCRIEWWRRILPSLDSGPRCLASFWRIISRANATRVYGRSETARIADPGEPSCIYRWELERAYDDRGNAVLFEYAADVGELDGQAFASPLYPVSVRYGNTAPIDRAKWLADTFPPSGAESAWMFKLAFDYGPPTCDPAGTLDLLVSQAEVPTGRERAIKPTDGPLRPDQTNSHRSGFSIRTRRLCRRILAYHAIPGAYEGLTRTLELTYVENPFVSRLAAITEVDWNGASGRARPPLQFTYSDAANLATVKLRSLAGSSLPTLRPAIDAARYDWIDLDGEGAPGVLFQSAGGSWFYARNSGGGRFAPPQPVDFRPALDGHSRARSATSASKLLDLGGDGMLDLVDFRRPAAGAHKRQSDYKWAPFEPFVTAPQLDPNDPNVRFLDLDGDGLSDLVRSEDGAYVWQRSLGELGFAEPARIAWADGESAGPRLLFADRRGTVFLADLTGDGLTDLVRVRNGEVSCWHNLGHGRFGPRTTCAIRDDGGSATGEAFVFDSSERFDPSRIRLLDIDGTGSTDIVYLGRNGIRCWRNQSGNGFSQPQSIPFPPIDDPSAVSVLDLLANGTDCLVFAPGTPGLDGALQYLSLAGGIPEDDASVSAAERLQKPHVLVSCTNNLGGETRFHHTTSARSCISDRDNGTRWATKIGFPVVVLARLEQVDTVTGKILVNSYRYRHGHYDGKEREFCGFGFVEQTDTVSYEQFADIGAAAIAGGPTNADTGVHLPPAVTRTWFHTGAATRGESLTRRFAREYFAGDTAASAMADVTLPPLTDAETTEALRCLRGLMLRQEIYAEELGGLQPEQERRPYSVTDRHYTIKRLQVRVANTPGAYFAYQSQQFDRSYERQRDDARIVHKLVLDVDAWGNETESASAAYGRLPSGLMRDACLLTEAERAVAATTALEYSVGRYTNDFADAAASPNDHHAALLAEKTTWEIAGLAAVGPNGHYLASDLVGLGTSTRLSEFGFVDVAVTGSLARRRIEQERHHYWAKSGARRLGELGLPALPHQSFKLAFDYAMVNAIGKAASEDIPPLAMTAAGYRRLSDLPANQFAPDSWPNDADARAWWAPSPFSQYEAAAFYQPTRHYDSFYSQSTQQYGVGALLPEFVRDAVGNDTRMVNDYRLLQARQLTDANGAVVELRFDHAGIVVASAVRGNGSQPTGDTLDGIAVDLSVAEVAAFMAAPATAGAVDSGAATSLRRATQRFIYDRFAACNLNKPIVRPDERRRALTLTHPVWVAAVARTFHVKDDAQSPVEISIAYADGFGAPAQTKQLTDGNGAAPVWIGSGWTIYDNKNSEVRTYEPYFTSTHLFEANRREGAAQIIIRDPVKRVRVTVTPHRRFSETGDVSSTAPVGHSYEKHLLRAWGAETWDGNDTVLLNPMDDPDIAGLVARFTETEFAPTWYQQRVSPELLVQTWPGDQERQRWEQQAAEGAATHAATPTRSYLDPLGRTFLTIAQHRRETDGADQFFHTRTVFDIRGRRLAVEDPRGRRVMAWDYSMVGTSWRSVSMDAGQRVMLVGVDGQPSIEWDAMGRRLSHRYDTLRRPVSVRVREDDTEVERESYVYGESIAGGASAYLRGRLIEEVGDGGTLAIEAYDCHGNPTDVRRTMSVARSVLRTESRRDAYDAQSRLVRSSSGGAAIKRGYSVSGQLLAVATSPGDRIVKHISYLPSGQRSRLTHAGKGPEVVTVSDPTTGRLVYQRADGLQDLRFVYDPAGNITHIHDASIAPVFFDGQRVDPLRRYRYDSLYRLIEASGREHCSRTSAMWNEQYRAGGPLDLCVHPKDKHAFRTYTEQFIYDDVDNLLRHRHVAGRGSWTRDFEVATASNRLQRATIGALPTDTLEADVHGNTTRMGHLEAIGWDYRDRLVSARRGNDTARFAYDTHGQRIAKVEPRGTRCYLGDFEFFDQGSATNSLIVGDKNGILAIIDHANGGNVQVRLQIADHLGSASAEVDLDGQVLGREEYYPFGGTSYQLSTSGVAARRYRFTAKERDEFTGLNYHGARYYSPWLARWISADPAIHGLNHYAYVNNRPIIQVDPTGMWDEVLRPAGSGSSDTQAPTETPAGTSVVTATRDAALRGGPATVYNSVQRSVYEAQNRLLSTDALEKILESRLTDDLNAAEAAARYASDLRTEGRKATQKLLTPGGRILSEFLEKPPRNFVDRAGGVRSFETYERIAENVGKSRPGLTTVGKAVGTSFIALDLGLASYNVMKAPEGQKVRAAVVEGSGIVGGAAGSALAVGALGLFMATPPGLAAAAAVGVGGALVGSTAVRSLAGAVYDNATASFAAVYAEMQNSISRLYGVPY
ncbi:SpvB/TcaC N-terminal domain-containing protein [Kaistia terrae]|uniref:SpvB/TcaC N-terminal domain-containing protein n=1 Tax=Kaistia terrae TaxID=537017 RepID=A0ABW0Q1C4_9HYPH|nr:SpvB/TcaC N-terminal domain-containing protein [Kaistia terrae]MCX5578924.1 hypothetical protein [Kaistia terrae]